MSTTSKSSTRDFRGAVVEDLQLAPAFCLSCNAPLSVALEAAYEREFDQLPVLGDNRRPIGYLDVPVIKQKFESGQIKEDDDVRTHTTYFRAFKANNPANSKPTSNPDASKETTPTPAGQSLTGPSTYRTIHPLTPLEDLEDFLKDHEFALVTDEGRKWVLGVATRSDLEASSEGMHCGEVGLLTMLAGCRLLSSGEDVIEPGAAGTKEAKSRRSRRTA